ncbi:MAG: nicotinamide-nucleotide amidohydrolase family protein [Exilispira sp.]
MKGIIFIIGSEILDGKTLDTNSIYLYKFCQRFGIHIDKKLIIKDDEKLIIDSINNEINYYDIFFFIGGLGPTFDDLTIDSISKIFNLKIQYDQSQSDKIKNFLSSRNINDQDIINLSLRQARYIGNSLKNSKGMSAGSYFQIDFNLNLIQNDLNKNDNLIKKYFFLLPGPQNEFESMLEEQVSHIIDKISEKKYHQKNLYVYNISESSLNNILRSMKLKTLYGIYAKGHFKVITFQSEDFESIVDDLHILINYDNLSGYYISELNKNFIFNKSIIDKKTFDFDKDIIITDEIDLSLLFFNFLQEKNLKFSAAESSSGGLLSQIFTAKESASKYFLGSIVCYSNYSKEKILYINKAVIEKYGPVSPEITLNLAKNANIIFGSDFSISITGYAGPSGGSDLYPVGTCFIGISSKNINNKTIENVYRCNFKGNRNNIQNLSVIFSIFLAIYNLYD